MAFFPLLHSKLTCTQHIKLDPSAMTAHARELLLRIYVSYELYFTSGDGRSRATGQ
jgi:hypothetical protein